MKVHHAQWDEFLLDSANRELKLFFKMHFSPDRLAIKVKWYLKVHDLIMNNHRKEILKKYLCWSCS